MDVLYVVGTGSKNDNVELRWSLRSVDKHASNVGRVVVAGYPPDFLSESVTRLPVPDLPNGHHKHVNVMNCIIEAIMSGALTGEFLYSSDDHFLIRDVDFDRYPYWVRTSSSLPSEADYAAKGKHVNAYRRSIVQTRRLLESEGYGITAFHMHANTHMHSADVGEVMRLVVKGMDMGLSYGFEPTDMFMNVRMRRDPVELTVRRDRKAREFPGREEFLADLGERDSFSVADQAFSSPGFVEFMEGEFGAKSRFER